MNPAFELPEYERRLTKVRSAMSDKELDALVIGDPANMNWLTGFDAWSFYVPQVMLVLHDHPPVWLGRQMDAGSVALTTHLGADSVRPYAEDLVQRDGVHPMEAIADSIANFDLKLNGEFVKGIESYASLSWLKLKKIYLMIITGPITTHRMSK